MPKYVQIIEKFQDNPWSLAYVVKIRQIWTHWLTSVPSLISISSKKYV